MSIPKAPKFVGTQATRRHSQAPSGTRCAGHVRDAGTFLGISRQFLGQGVHAMSGTQACFRAFLGRGAHATTRTWADFQAFLGSLWHMECWPLRGRRTFSGRVQATGRTQPDFQAFLGISGQFLSTVYRTYPGGIQALVMSGTCPGHDRDACRFSSTRRQCGVPAMSETHFYGHSVQDMSTMQPEFQAFLGKLCSGHVLVAARMQPDFQAFLGYGHVQDASWLRQGRSSIFRHTKVTRCADHVRDVGMFPGILGSFWDMVCRPCSRRVLVVAGKQPDFQAFLGSFWDMVSKPCPGCGHVQDAAGTYPYFQAFLGSFWDTVCRPCPRTKPDFQAFLGSFWDTVCWPCPGCILATTGMQCDFQAFLSCFWAQCAGTRPTVSGMQLDFETFLSNFWNMLCRPCPGSVWDAAYFSSISKQILGHGVKAMSVTHPGHGRDASRFSGE
ncbi:Hypothetical predicted protein [Olea europaea subsp. europaea]|uniref:Uncharacterized protein n=1 Tax=Olea europaea subsp. europaea TaxID=158383 RepID=A0A8S0T6L6_OLEEU|nr:Hypothetical predicted protein [Olea europaea subsp. europaea]